LPVGLFLLIFSLMPTATTFFVATIRRNDLA